MAYFSEILIIIWFLLTLSVAWAGHYKIALLRNVVAASFLCLYVLLVERYVAALVFFFSTSNSGVQYFMPESDAPAQKRLRNGIAVGVSILASALLYKAPVDLLPCIGFTCVRLGESQQSTKWTRIGFAVGMFIYAIYGAFEALYLMMTLQFLVAIAFAYKGWSSHALNKGESA